MTGRCILVWVHRESFPDNVPKLRPQRATQTLSTEGEERKKSPLGRMTGLYKSPDLGAGRRSVPMQLQEGGAVAGSSVPLHPYPQAIIDLLVFRLYVQKTGA